MPETNTQRLVDVAELGELIRRRRAAHKLTLRDVENQLDHAITASSLSCIERGAMPDARNVPILARWLEIPIGLVAWPEQARQPTKPVDTPSAVELHLRADRNLDPSAAEALAAMFRHLYEGVASGKLTVPVKGRKPRR